MTEKKYTKAEIEAALASAQHVTTGFIGIWRAAIGAEAVRLAEQVKDAFEADFKRLLRGTPTLSDHIHTHLNPDHGRLPGCGQYSKCKTADACKDCEYYEIFKEKLRDNFRN